MNTGGISAMLEEVKIENTNELEFAVFCIENIAIKLKKNRVGLAKAHLFFYLFHGKIIIFHDTFNCRLL